MTKTVKLSDTTITELEKHRNHHRETWDDLVKNVLKKAHSKTERRLKKR